MEAKIEKIKVAVSCEEIRELEISFPYYVGDGNLWCKFFRKNVGTWISDFPFKKQIEYSSGSMPDPWLLLDPITKEEFDVKFNEVMAALINIHYEKDI